MAQTPSSQLNEGGGGGVVLSSVVQAKGLRFLAQLCDCNHKNNTLLLKIGQHKNTETCREFLLKFLSVKKRVHLGARSQQPEINAPESNSSQFLGCI